MGERERREEGTGRRKELHTLEEFKKTRKCIHMTQRLTAVEGPSQCGITAEKQGTTPRPAVA